MDVRSKYGKERKGNLTAWNASTRKNEEKKLH